MTRVRIPLLLCVALLASAAAPAAGAPEGRGSSTTVSGVYSVTFNLSLASRLPAGSTITCRAQVMPNQEGLNFPHPQLAATPVETVAGLAAVTGSTATCATEIPFAWTVTSGQGGIVLSYDIYAVSNSGTALLLRRSVRQSISAAFPASGGSVSLSLNLTL